MSPLVLFASSCLRGGVEEPTDARSILEGQVVLQAGRALVGEDEAPLGLHGLEAMTTVWAENVVLHQSPPVPWRSDFKVANRKKERNKNRSRKKKRRRRGRGGDRADWVRYNQQLSMAPLKSFVILTFSDKASYCSLLSPVGPSQESQ